MGWFLLGNIYRDLYNSLDDGRPEAREYLTGARNSYAKVLRINPDAEFARNAKAYLTQIDSALVALSTGK